MIPATAPVIPESALAHHVALGALLVNVFPLGPDGRHYLDDEAIYSLTFTSSILQIITREILQLGPQTSFQALLSQTDPLVQAETKRVARSSRRRRERGESQLQHVEAFEVFSSWLGHFPETFADPCIGCEYLRDMEQKLFRLFVEEDDNGELPLAPIPRPLDHSSLLGIFARSLLLTLRKLSFDESVALTKLVGQWCGTQGVAGPSRPAATGIYSMNRKTAMDDTFDKRKEAMQRYQAAAASGDHTRALHALRQFYDYDFPSNLRSQHQHALLGLATFHHATGGSETSRSLTNEAIRVARAEGDKQCLQRCLSLIKRLDIESGPGISDLRSLKVVQGPVSSLQLPPATSAMDELWCIKAAIDLGEPIHIAFERTHRALARHEVSVSPADERPPGKDLLDLATWHASQAGLWSMMGSETLARLHEDLATTPSSNRDGRLTVALSRAVRAADRAVYDEALGLLLDPALLQDMTIQEYERWTGVLWAILDRQISFSGDPEAWSILQRLQGSKSESDTSIQSSQTGVKSVIEALRDALRKAKKLSEANVPAQLVLPRLLSCTELSASLGLWPMYRLAVVILGYVLLSLEASGMAQKAIDQVMEVWPQVLGSSDQEAKAIGALVLGKAKVDLALEGRSEPLLDEARAHLHTALHSSRVLGSQSLVVQCTTLLSLIGQVTGSTDERDDMSRAWQQAQCGDAGELAKRRDQLRQIGEVVKLVGVRISLGTGMSV